MSVVTSLPFVFEEAIFFFKLLRVAGRGLWSTRARTEQQNSAARERGEAGEGNRCAATGAWQRGGVTAGSRAGFKRAHNEKRIYLTILSYTVVLQ